MLNTPTITNSMHTHSIYDGAGTAVPGSLGAGLGIVQHMSPAIKKQNIDDLLRQAELAGRYPNREMGAIGSIGQKPIHQENIMSTNSKRRIVKVIIVDTDDNVPLDKCVLYSGEEKMTDATDQELFFEIDIKGILDKHNEYRVTLTDKSIKERVEKLEPVKIRDLRMVVVNVAQF